ncbi:MAG TPA: LysR substrate-binding domain-containing protein, partial [Polyangiales bacterium]|nr:LysR substrate-binding domain-containing protein [Polyangiales bacterium]
DVELHAHRGPTLLERLRSGDYSVGFCPASVGDPELVVRELAREAMVIVPAGLEPLARAPVIQAWSIETRSLTWEAIATRLARVKRTAGYSIEVGQRLETFTALVQVARAGFANVLVPIGVARELGVPLDRIVRVPGLSRPIAAVGRRKGLEQPAVKSMLAELARHWPAVTHA